MWGWGSVLIGRSSSPPPTNPLPRRLRRAAHAAPPSGQMSTPLRRDNSAAAGAISLSGTALPVPPGLLRAPGAREAPDGGGTPTPHAAQGGTRDRVLGAPPPRQTT